MDYTAHDPGKNKGGNVVRMDGSAEWIPFSAKEWTLTGVHWVPARTWIKKDNFEFGGANKYGPDGRYFFWIDGTARTVPRMGTVQALPVGVNY